MVVWELKFLCFRYVFFPVNKHLSRLFSFKEKRVFSLKSHITTLIYVRFENRPVYLQQVLTDCKRGFGRT